MTKYWFIGSDSVGMRVLTFDSIAQAQKYGERDQKGDSPWYHARIIYVIDALPVEQWIWSHTSGWVKVPGT